MNFKSPPFKLFVKILAGIVIFAVLFYWMRAFDWSAVGQALQTADLRYFWVAGLGLIGMWFSRTAILQVLLRIRKALAPSLVFRVSLMGAALDQIIPGRAGYLLRWALFSSEMPAAKTFILSALLTSVFIEGASLIFLVLLSAVFDERVQAYASLQTLLIFGTVIVLGSMAVALSTRYLQKISALQSIVEVASEIKQLKKFLQLFSIALFSWASQITIVYFVGQSLQLHFEFFQMIVVLLAINLAIVIPIIPGNLGTMQLVITSVLAQFQVDTEKAFAFSILFHAFHLIPTIGLGSIFGLSGATPLFGPRSRSPQLSSEFDIVPGEDSTGHGNRSAEKIDNR